MEKKIETLLTEFSQQALLPDAQSSNPNNQRTNGYFESIREDVNMLDATAFREWRTICNESLVQLLPKVPEAQQQPQQQPLLMTDGSVAVQDGINLTQIDKTTLPAAEIYQNTQINVPPPPDVTGTNQEIVDYSIQDTVQKDVADNTSCHDLWKAQFGKG